MDECGLAELQFNVKQIEVWIDGPAASLPEV